MTDDNELPANGINVRIQPEMMRRIDRMIPSRYNTRSALVVDAVARLLSEEENIYRADQTIIEHLESGRYDQFLDKRLKQLLAVLGSNPIPRILFYSRHT